MLDKCYNIGKVLNYLQSGQFFEATKIIMPRLVLYAWYTLELGEHMAFHGQQIKEKYNWYGKLIEMYFIFHLFYYCGVFF